LTANTVLEKLKANPTSSAVLRSTLAKNRSPENPKQNRAKPNTVTDRPICKSPAPHTSGLRRFLIFNFNPMVKSRSVTPKSAPILSSGVDVKPAAESASPASRNPTMGGSPRRYTRYPRTKAEERIIVSKVSLYKSSSIDMKNFFVKNV